MRRILFLTASLLLAIVPAQGGHTPPKVSLHVHIQTPGSGQSSMEVSSIQIPPNGETIQIRTMPEVNEHELVSVVQDGGTLRLKFNHVGQVNLGAATAQNYEGRMMVVLLNGVLIYAPVIDVQITNGELDIPITLKPDVITALQQTAAENVRKANKI